MTQYNSVTHAASSCANPPFLKSVCPASFAMSLSSLWQRLCRPNAKSQPAEASALGYESEADSDCLPLQDQPNHESDHFSSKRSEPPRSESADSDSDMSQSESKSSRLETDQSEPEDDDPTDSEESGSESQSDSPTTKRRQRTENARKAAAESRLVKKMAKQYAIQPPEKNAEYLPFLKGNDAQKLTTGGQSQKDMTRTRRRLIYSWFKNACSFINSFFEQHACQHVFSVSVIDDTNTSLSTQVTAQSHSSRTVTMLNNVQTCVACFEVAQSDGQKQMQQRSFPMHTPPTCLPRADAPNLLQELRSWLLFEPGSRWEKFGLKSGLLTKVPFVCHIMCFDSLATNVRLLKMLRRLFFKRRQHEQGQVDQVQLLTGLVCAIHQLALARKALLFYHSGLWSNIVRLSHLFATQNFRVQFRSALFAVVADNFRHMPVHSLPQQHAEWKRDRDQLFNLLASDADYCKTRLLFHKKLARFDNGDPNSPSFTHWCLGNGECCQGETPAERSNHCFIMLCKCLYYLFCLGYAVPLSYRWKHSQPALRFCQDSSFFRPRILGQSNTTDLWYDMIWR